MSGSAISPAFKISIIAGAGESFPLPLWITSQLGGTPALNQVIKVQPWNYTDFAASIFNGDNVASILESFSGSIAIFESDSLGGSLNGGHTDADWNGMFGLPFESDTPTPYRLVPRSASRPGGVFYNPGGFPATAHTYSQQVANDALRRIFQVGRSFCNGNFDPNCGELDGLDPGSTSVTDSGAWEQSSPGVSAYPQVPGSWGAADSTWGNSPAAWDRNTWDMFQFNAGGLRHWVRATGAKGTWFTRNSTPRATNSAIAYDPIRDRLLAIGCTSGSQVPIYAKRSENFATWHNLSMSGSTSGLSTDYFSVCFDPWVNGGAGGIWLCNDITSRAAGFRLMTFADSTADSAAVVTNVGFSGVNPSTAFNWGSEGTCRYGAVRHIRRLKGITWRTAAAGGQYFVRTAA